MKIITPSLFEKGFFITFFKKNNFLNTKIFIWLILLYFPIFLNLGGLVMHRWDEARYGVSSYEMLHGSNPWVVTYLNEPCMGTAKPPLMHWFQALSIKLLGFHETSVRLPSAIAGLMICIAMMYISLKKFRSFSFGALTSLILVCTNNAFCGIDHCARTGDYDALLMLFSFLGIFAFYYYNENPKNKKYLVLTFVFITLAILTKAVAGLFFAPGMLLYLILKGNLPSLLKNKWFYISLGCSVIVLSFIFLIREYYTPGYLKALNDNELLGRHSVSMDGHKGDFWYYLRDIQARFDFAFFLIPFSWLLGLSSRDQQVRSFSLYTLVLSVSFYIILSSAESKLYWYAFPLLPVLSIQMGLLALTFLKKICTSAGNNNKPATLYYLSLAFALCVPYTFTIEKSYKRDLPTDYRRWNNIQEYCMLERNLIRNAILIAHPADYQIPYRFYYLKLNELGFNLKYEVGCSERWQPGNTLIVEAPEYQTYVEQNYDTEVIDIFNHLKVYKIRAKKITEPEETAGSSAPIS